MADTEHNILISAAGGDSAAAEIAKVTKGFNNTVVSHNELKKKFAERLRHVGVDIFGGQLLHLGGVTGHTRGIMNLLNLTVQSTAASMGIAAGPIGLIVFGLTALAAVISKVVSGQQKHREELEKQRAETKKLLDQVQSNISTLDKYRESFGMLTPAMERLAKSSEAYKKELMAIEKVENEKRIKDLTKAIQEQTDVVATSLTKESTMRKEVVALLLSGNLAAATAKTLEIELGDVREKSAEKAQESQIQIRKNQVEIDALIQRNVELSRGEVKGIEGAIEANNKLMEVQNRIADRIIAAEQVKRQQILATQKAVSDSMRKQRDEFNEFIGTEQALFRRGFEDISKGVGDSFTRMVVYGDSFGKNMHKVINSVRDAFISAVVQMATKMLVLRAFGAIGAPSLAGIPTPMSGGFMMAGGGDVMVNRPTMFVAGEAGPERATFTPMGGGGGSGQSRNVSVGAINISVNAGGGDPSRIADAVGKEIVRRIRGLGEIDFRRTT